MSMAPTRIAALVVLACGSSATAQCSFFRGWVPDFDQRRQAGPGVSGLPGSGAMYCAPTSVLNWFAYFSNRGLPQPVILDGPRNWQAAPNYPRVTFGLTIMGSLMNTHAVTGTTGNGMRDGGRQYSTLYASNKVNVGTFFCGGGPCGYGPNLFRLLHGAGGFTAACYGFYTESPPGFFTRVGGHCVTVVGSNACNGLSTVTFRDPASDGFNTTQSVFMSHSVTTIPVSAQFRPMGGDYVAGTRHRMIYGSSLNFIDGLFVLVPKFALSTSLIDAGQILVTRPFLLDDSELPETQTWPTHAASGPIKGLAMHPTMGEWYYVSDPATGSVVQRIFRVDPSTGVSTPMASSSSALSHLVTNRFGDLYYVDGLTLRRVSTEGTVPIQLGSIAISATPEAVAYDDTTSTLALLFGTAQPDVKTLRRYTSELLLIESNNLFHLPSSSGQMSIDYAPDGTLFFAASGNPRILQFNANGTSQLAWINLPAGTSPRNLRVGEDGHLIFRSGGVLSELMKNAAGAWVNDPASDWVGRSVGDHFLISRSRTNHMPEIHEGPGYYHLADPEVAPGILDCYANCDFSTVPPVLNVNDFQCFLNLYAAGRPDANCDGSTTAPMLNINDFQCFLNAYAAGCP
ncbi:MAG: hypothetical protein JNM80_03485 [Phycisphaerae bacterium]|nr:hypothetical protein [Phycisphaerae bacterium]